MSITCMRPRTISISRKTATVFESSSGVATNPETPAYIEVTVDSAVSVVVCGISDGSPRTETLTFATPGAKTTCARFSSLSVSAAGANVRAVAVGSDGSRIESTTKIVEGVRAHFDWVRGDYPRDKPGSTGTQVPWFGIDWTPAFNIRRGDIIADGTSTYEVKHANVLEDMQGPHHWEVWTEEVIGAL